MDRKRYKIRKIMLSQSQHSLHHLNHTTKAAAVKNVLPCIIQNHHSFLNSVFGTNLTKTEIWKCPLKKFDGKVYIISSENDQRRKKVRDAIERIMASKVVGFDTETAVTFPRDNSALRHIGLVQIAIDSDVILWRLRKRKKYTWKKFPSTLQTILANNNIIKVGNGTYDDLKDLYESYNVTVSNMVDNQTIATDIGYNKIGLVPLAAQLFGWRISKAEQISNWEVSDLSEAQIEYASTDAWASLKIYRELFKMATLLKKGHPTKGTSSFEHILRREAKMDSDFLHSLDFFTERLHTKNQHHLRKTMSMRQKARINFNAVDYDFTNISLQSSSRQNELKTYKENSSQYPFIYQAIKSLVVT